MKPVRFLMTDRLPDLVRFYVDQMGFGLDWQDERGAAQVSPARSLPLLLVGNPDLDLTPWLGEPSGEAKPGRPIYLTAPADLAEYRTALAGRGLTPPPVQTESNGDLTFSLPDPDGRLLQFWQPAPVSDSELLRRYEAAPASLAQAVRGLSEPDLDLVRAPGKWSIRQTVHHLADSAGSSLARVLMALAEPGREFRSNPYSQDRWVENLDHAHRPVATSVDLLRAIHLHLAGLVRHLPDGLDRTLNLSASGPTSVREMLAMLSAHVAGHVEQILETRRVHGLDR